MKTEEVWFKAYCAALAGNPLRNCGNVSSLITIATLVAEESVRAFEEKFGGDLRKVEEAPQ